MFFWSSVSNFGSRIRLLRDGWTYPKWMMIPLALFWYYGYLLPLPSHFHSKLLRTLQWLTLDEDAVDLGVDVVTEDAVVEDLAAVVAKMRRRNGE